MRSTSAALRARCCDMLLVGATGEVDCGSRASSPTTWGLMPLRFQIDASLSQRAAICHRVTVARFSVAVRTRVQRMKRARRIFHSFGIRHHRAKLTCHCRAWSTWHLARARLAAEFLPTRDLQGPLYSTLSHT